MSIEQGLLPNDELFTAAMAQVFEHEGVYSNNKSDPGGETKYGISARFLKENNIHLVIKELTQRQALFFYRKFFWDKYKFNKLTQEPVATKLFDTTVNIGPKPAIKMAQQLVSRFFDEFAIDGIMGPQTQSALNAVNDTYFVENYRDALVRYYNNLVIANNSLEVFLKGWLKRANS